MTLKVDVQAVADVLRDIARGHVTAETWHDGASAWFVRSSGYQIEIFDDAGVADYVERVTDPQGKTATFSQFMNALGHDPIDNLSAADRAALGERLRGDMYAARAPIKKPGKKGARDSGNCGSAWDSAVRRAAGTTLHRRVFRPASCGCDDA